ncbi:hypothetical protein KFK09_007804 [Dendrobium nobile]|uniref:Uncharacterized protein n=1 Tax=Dendrobium nobile TaxID=94219 RepID=A0A8T3BSS1_DENNO|nr:hypothetical protein KFK09_007804 [Dendrobium nobile]
MPITSASKPLINLYDNRLAHKSSEVEEASSSSRRVRVLVAERAGDRWENIFKRV